jgi:hypothetical protein
MTLKEFYADIAFSFVAKYSPQIIEKARKVSNNPKQLIKSHILKHMDYGTIVLYWDKNELIGVCNFDVKDDTAHVLHCVVHPDYRNKDVLKRMTLKALLTWPFLRYISFSRSLKGKPRRTIEIVRLIKSATQ